MPINAGSEDPMDPNRPSCKEVLPLLDYITDVFSSPMLINGDQFIDCHWCQCHKFNPALIIDPPFVVTGMNVWKL